jgi:PKD repeat protein
MRSAFIQYLVFHLVFLLLTSCDKDDPAPAPDAPKACFNVSGDLKSSIPITFTSDCSVNAVTYLWDFGDSKTSTEANPVHSYSAGGKFSVTLTVKNANGAEHTVTQTLEITKVETVTHFGDINANEIWKAGVIHVIFSSVRINNATVTIEPGAVVRFMDRAYVDGEPGQALQRQHSLRKVLQISQFYSRPTPVHQLPAIGVVLILARVIQVTVLLSIALSSTVVDMTHTTTH